MEGVCKRCGMPVKWVTLKPSIDFIPLDTTPSFEGKYRLVGKDREACERITVPGHQGYQHHDETCRVLETTP